MFPVLFHRCFFHYNLKVAQKVHLIKIVISFSVVKAASCICNEKKLEIIHFGNTKLTKEHSYLHQVHTMYNFLYITHKVEVPCYKRHTVTYAFGSFKITTQHMSKYTICLLVNCNTLNKTACPPQ